MAIYHLNVKSGSRGGGQSAGAKSDYLNRAGKYDKKKTNLLYSKSNNMPEWAQNDPTQYWQAADLYERANGTLFREVEFALPIELNLEQQTVLAEEFSNHLSQGNLPYSMVIHSKQSDNPHCHLMLSERINDGHSRTSETWFKRAANKGRDPEFGGARKADIGSRRKAWLEQTREAWAMHANYALEQAGHNVMIDHRTLEEQGIERIPGVHLGPHVVAMEEKGIQTDRAEIHMQVVEANIQIERLKEHDRTIERDRAHLESQREQTGRTSGRTDRAISPEHGSTGGRSEGAYTKDATDQRSTDSGLEQHSGKNYKKLGGEFKSSGRSSKQVEDQRTEIGTPHAWLDMEIMDWGDSRWSDQWCSSAERVYDLAKPLFRDRSPGETMEMVYGRLREVEQGWKRQYQKVTGMVDFTIQAVRKQLNAMKCRLYEIGIRDVNTGKMMNRTMSSNDIKKSVPWLKRMNAKRNDIYIRPHKMEKHGLVLVDDVDGVTISDMATNGHNYVLNVETSPENSQVWVKIGNEVSGQIRGEAGRLLAKMYGADPNSADSRHYGRLAGFTNQKPEHQDKYGRQPYCLVRKSFAKSEVAPKGAELVREATKRVEVKNRARERSDRIQRIHQVDDRWYLPVERYRSEMRGIIKRYGNQTDLSRADWMACKKLAKSGLSEQEIRKVLMEASPHITDRKGSNAENYADRTAKNLMKDPEVQKSLSQALGYGMSR